MSPYRNDNEAIKFVPKVHAGTAWQSPEIHQNYILVLRVALCLGYTLDHTLVDPNQLRHYVTQVQNNPMSESPLSIITEDGELSMELSMEGTILFSKT